jgi:predicted nucleic acid-binding protein
MIYADTSFIVSAYTSDLNSPEATDFLGSHKPTLPFVFLHWPEVAGSLWKSQPAPGKIWDMIQEDIYGGKKMQLLALDAETIGRRAAGLMKHYCPRWKKLRSLDALHVSAAVCGRFDTFLSFDSASFQRVLAHDQKLKVWPPLTDAEKARLKESAA